MPFRIPKATFPPHFFRLYLRCCSLLWRNLFFIISYSKSILFLNLFVCNVNNSSMQFSGSVAALLSPILRKFYSRLLKKYQTTIDDIVSPLLLGETLFSCNFCITNWDYIFLICFCLLAYNIYFIKFIEIQFMCTNCFF